jgi:hypothetical protein
MGLRLIDQYLKSVPECASSVRDFEHWSANPRAPDDVDDIAIFSRFNHPLAQAPYWNISPLYYWQRRLIHHLAMPKSRVAISTCNGSGKTAEIVPLFGLSVMAAFPGAVVFSTAGAEEQIRGQLWKYLQGKVRPYEDNGWKIKSGENLELWGPSIDGLNSRWIGRVPSRALTMEGYHPFIDRGKSGQRYYRPVCLILDEAKSLDDTIFQAAYRIDPDWLLVISTPADSEGSFYNAIEPDQLQSVEHRDQWDPELEELIA